MNTLEEQTTEILTVTQVTNYLKSLLKTQPLLLNLSVTGEVTGLTRHQSGHIYFSLKDENALIRCAFFKYYQKEKYEFLKEGAQVIVKGRVDIYEKRGDLQFYVKSVIDYGRGRLYAELERLKKEYEKKGYFRPEIKKQIPIFPEKVGIVTAKTGAAIRDILRVYKEQGFNAEIFLAHSRVQGDGAAAEIANAIKKFNTIDSLDVIIVARGGGAYEDLWCFNEPEVVEAIYESKIPIVTGIGHEIDFTLADFTADFRAATPTQAAQVVFTDRREYLKKIADLKNRMLTSIKSTIDYNKKTLKMYSIPKISGNVLNYIQKYAQWLDNCELRLKSAVNSSLKLKKQRIYTFFRLIPKTQQKISGLKRNLSQYKPENMAKIITSLCALKRKNIISSKEKIYPLIKNSIEKNRMKINHIKEKMVILSPENTLKRGYALVIKENTVIKDKNKLNSGDEVKLRLFNGEKEAFIK